ncbi:MAG TPA: tetratricopeptide repeat protein, partial [Methanothrix sp.]|nr:tetratricopeptide repeat protein [Methanothrix sp.]
MTGTDGLPLLGLLAEALGRGNGCDPEQLKSLSLGDTGPLSSFVSALLSTDENQVQERLAEMAGHLAPSGNSRDWFDLGRVAHALYFRQAAEEYFLRSLDLAREQKEDLMQSSAYLSLGVLYSEDENWDLAVQYYRKALSLGQAAEEETAHIHEILVNMGRACRLQGDLAAARECYSQAMDLLDEDDLAGRSQALYALGEISAEKGELDEAQQFYEKSGTLCR